MNHSGNMEKICSSCEQKQFEGWRKELCYFCGRKVRDVPTVVASVSPMACEAKAPRLEDLADDDYDDEDSEYGAPEMPDCLY